MLAAHDAGDAGDREALTWVRGLPSPDAYADADAVWPLSWWLAGGIRPPSDGDGRELAAHGHRDGWLESLRQLYAGVDPEPSFSATAMAVLARYARSIDRNAWDLLARGVEGDGANVAGYVLASWLDAHPAADLDGIADGGDDVTPDDAGGGSASAP